MMKFFRKHNKKLLAVFGVLLMLVFVAGGALDDLLQAGGDAVVAKTNLGSISYTDQELANGLTSILAAIGLDWQRPFPTFNEPLDTIDWIILAREAEQLGMGSNAGSVRSSLAFQSGIDGVARQLRVKSDRILQAMAEYTAIREAALAVAGATALSEAEVLAAARNALEKVRIGAVMLPAEAFVEEDPEFTEAEIEAQFTAYREREPGPGLEFGYYVPPALKVQYIRIDREAIAGGIRVANLEKKAKEHFDERREEDPAFRRPAEETAAAEDETLEGPLPEEPVDRGPYLDWEEAREAAIEIVRKQEAAGAAARIADWFVQYTTEAWLDVQRGEDGYKVAPENVAKLDYYDNVLQRIPATIGYPEAVHTGGTDYFSRAEVGDIPLLGGARFRPERGTGTPAAMAVQFPTLAFRTKAIVPIVPNEKGTNRSDYLATFETCRYPLTDPDGNVFLFRVVDGRDGHAAESVDEVRDRVLSDLRLLQGYRAAKERAESLRSCATSMSLQEAHESDEELADRLGAAIGQEAGGYFEPLPFARATISQAGRGRERTTAWVGGGVGSLSDEVVDECFALAEADSRIKVIELKDRATIMVAEWVETLPAQADEFEDMREGLVQQMFRFHSQAAITDWLNPEQIRARNGFALVTE